tara:strand:+ start:132 stop:326 length:195 start_codon:yes stop_codon:yes gene_type:complete
MEDPIIAALAAIQDELTKAIHEALKFNNGNSSAGTRVRRAMQNIKSQAQVARMEVQAKKNESVL